MQRFLETCSSSQTPITQTPQASPGVRLIMRSLPALKAPFIFNRNADMCAPFDLGWYPSLIIAGVINLTAVKTMGAMRWHEQRALHVMI